MEKVNSCPIRQCMSQGSSAGESAPCPPSSTEEGVHPSCGSAVASVSPAPSVEDVVAPTSVPSTRGDSNDPGRPEVVAEEKNVPEQSSSAAPEDQTHVLSPLREVSTSLRGRGSWRLNVGGMSKSTLPWSSLTVDRSHGNVVFALLARSALVGFHGIRVNFFCLFF